MTRVERNKMSELRKNEQSSWVTWSWVEELSFPSLEHEPQYLACAKGILSESNEIKTNMHMCMKCSLQHMCYSYLTHVNQGKL